MGGKKTKKPDVFKKLRGEPFLFANRAVTTTTGYEPHEIIGGNPRLWGKQMEKSVFELMWKTIKEEKKTYRGEITNKRKSGQRYVANVTISPIIDQHGALIGFIGIE